MAKTKTRYVCAQCGHEAAAWTGRCPSCSAWNSMEPVEVAGPSVSAGMAGAKEARVYDLSSIPADSGTRYRTGINELDRVLGGGVVPGAVVLAGGEPGVGKSTLFLQMADRLTAFGPVLYVSGEESPAQLRMRAERLGVQGSVKVMAETELGAITDGIRKTRPGFVIVDSIQTLYDETQSSAPGSVVQVRGCASALARLAKRSGIPVFIIGHVTKEGAIAGPRILEHLVDTVLYFEGERTSNLRILRAAKNRFGGTDELGLFEMAETGMREVAEPGFLFGLQSDLGQLDGVAVYPATQGARPLLLEIQALCSNTQLNIPRRLSSGIDAGRLYMICAVLEKKVGLKLYTQDVFVNVTGGVRVREYASDLALAMAIVSSFRSRPLPADTAFIGEIGLSGELRPAGQMDRRLRECARMGMQRVVLPRGRIPDGAPEGIELVECRTLFDAFEKVL